MDFSSRPGHSEPVKCPLKVFKPFILHPLPTRLQISVEFRAIHNNALEIAVGINKTMKDAQPELD